MLGVCGDEAAADGEVHCRAGEDAAREEIHGHHTLP